MWARPASVAGRPTWENLARKKLYQKPSFPWFIRKVGHSMSCHSKFQVFSLHYLQDCLAQNLDDFFHYSNHFPKSSFFTGSRLSGSHFTLCRRPRCVGGDKLRGSNFFQRKKRVGHMHWMLIYVDKIQNNPLRRLQHFRYSFETVEFRINTGRNSSPEVSLS